MYIGKMRGKMIAVEGVRELLIDLANAGSNMRVFLSEMNEFGATIPDPKYRVVRAVAAKYEEQGRPKFVFIIPKYKNHAINYLINGDNKKENSHGIEYFFADRTHASIRLSNGFNYMIYYRHGSFPRREREIMESKGMDFNISEFFGVNY